MELAVVFTCSSYIWLYVAIVEPSDYDVYVQLLSVNYCHADTAMLEGN